VIKVTKGPYQIYLDTSRIKVYGDVMPKWICKVSGSGRQVRITIPRGLLDFRAWFDLRYVILEDDGENPVTIREFIDGESLKNEGSGNKAGSHR